MLILFCIKPVRVRVRADPETADPRTGHPFFLNPAPGSDAARGVGVFTAVCGMTGAGVPAGLLTVLTSVPPGNAKVSDIQYTVRDIH